MFSKDYIERNGLRGEGMMEKDDKVKKLMQKIEAELSSTPLARSCYYWAKTECPNCETANWVTNEDDFCDEDSSRMDNPLDACRCYSCGIEFWIDSTIEWRLKTNMLTNELYSIDLRDEIVVKDGKEKPE